MNNVPFLRSAVVAALFVGLGLSGRAQLITYQITVQPIHITDLGGIYGTAAFTANSSDLYYESAIDRIFAQAGVDVKFLNAVSYPVAGVNFRSNVNPAAANVTTLLSAWNTATGNGANNSFLRLFFIESFSGGVVGSSVVGSYVPFEDFGIYGSNPSEARYGMAVAVSNGAIGRLDTIAHEIGHALSYDGDHTLLGISSTPEPNNNFMAAGTSRLVPAAVGDIFNPILGGTVDILDAEQKSRIFDMYGATGNTGAFVGSAAYLKLLPVNQQYDYSAVPEPAHMALGAGFAALLATFRRRRRDRPAAPIPMAMIDLKGSRIDS